jgi:hypothetical protein
MFACRPKYCNINISCILCMQWNSIMCIADCWQSQSSYLLPPWSLTLLAPLISISVGGWMLELALDRYSREQYSQVHRSGIAQYRTLSVCVWNLPSTGKLHRLLFRDIVIILMLPVFFQADSDSHCEFLKEHCVIENIELKLNREISQNFLLCMKC